MNTSANIDLSKFETSTYNCSRPIFTFFFYLILLSWYVWCLILTFLLKGNFSILVSWMILIYFYHQSIGFKSLKADLGACVNGLSNFIRNTISGSFLALLNRPSVAAKLGVYLEWPHINHIKCLLFT